MVVRPSPARITPRWYPAGGKSRPGVYQPSWPYTIGSNLKFSPRTHVDVLQLSSWTDSCRILAVFVPDSRQSGAKSICRFAFRTGVVSLLLRNGLIAIEPRKSAVRREPRARGYTRRLGTEYCQMPDFVRFFIVSIS